MQVVHGGQPHKIAVLRIVIKDLLLLLLEHSTNGTVTCATQILKRAGAVIEQTGYLNKPEEGNFSEVFSQLRQLLDKGRLNQTTRASITSLLDLKSHNWVRRDSSQHHPVSTRVDYEEVYQDRMRHTDSRILENNEIEGTGNGNQKSVDTTDDKYMCKICFDDPVEVTFLPCMHACCCKNCSDKLKPKQCPICRKRIRQSRTLYFS
ncbi:polyadenylate-binding protein-interacting protein 1 [Mytilus galloprovincialis]|uniref:Polyadenylate-binding protein-interacting protein 1 n=1 Tax=Mytilus galloprovincialis TaxID=29158 RepID=A0A8B6FW53_MYTGA|nr:polyadenylate-binding protein-interacting protein 1 [Mytilus galloprovincialis]